jgi:pimeloyl-ACP methyl ester carboxylesterase
LNNQSTSLYDQQTTQFESAGKGPAIVLLHGFCESSGIFSRLITDLSPAAYVLAPNLPGHGGTPWQGGLRSLSYAADWLRDFLDEQNIVQCILVGHSLGGYIAAAFAERYPERLRGLAMLHSTALPDTEERQTNRNKALDFIAKNGVQPFLKAFVESLFFDPRPDPINMGWKSKLFQITSQTDPEAIVAFIRLMRDRPDRVAALRALKVPVMYIIGENDTLVPPLRIQDELSRVELALLHRIPEAGHMGMYEAPKKVRAAIESLIELSGSDLKS